MSKELKEDFLSVDPPIPGQKFVCLSFLSPEKVLEDKHLYYMWHYERHLQSKIEELNGKLKEALNSEDTGVEILLAGRSNAGKSSALNALTENRKLARISKTPGRTTEVNYFRVNENLKLVDLPGYGYAKSGYSRRKDWGPLLGQYFEERQSFKAVLVFMDIRHPLKDTDLELIGLCKDSEVDCIPVLTKSDKLSKNKVAQAVALGGRL